MRSGSGFGRSLSGLFIGIAVGAVSFAWISAGQNDGSAHKAAEQRYLHQIKSLKHALSQSVRAHSQEQKLASRLQRELSDAHRQINELESTKGRRGGSKAKAERRAAITTSGSVVLTYASQRLPEYAARNAAGITRRVSPYAPRTKGNSEVGTARRAGSNVVRAGRQRVKVALGRDRYKPRRQPRVANSVLRVQPPSAAIVQPLLTPSRLVAAAPHTAKPPRIANRRPVRRRSRASRTAYLRRRDARFRPRSRLGRLQRRRSSRSYRKRRARGDLFSRLNRRGVFGGDR